MKNFEIERKFIVDKDNLPFLSNQNYMDIVQGYIQNIGGDYIYRLRQILHMSFDKSNIGEQYFQTIKGKGMKIREEYEIELLKPQFYNLWPLCKNISIHKHRYKIFIDKNLDGFLDIYANNLKGLITIEVEFENEIDCDNFIPPIWFGKEITQNKEYSNFNLSLYGNPSEKSL